MSFLRPTHRRSWGFTLVELLTVVAIVGVLATLLSSGLASAKRKARKAASISNLRQIAMAVNLYTDDHDRRPDLFRTLVDKQFLSGRVLFCPEDRTTNWAGNLGLSLPTKNRGQLGLIPGEPEVPHSYFESFSRSDEEWEQISRMPFGGIAACQLHGIGRINPENPSLTDFQGLVLRALKDGAVVSRQKFWQTEADSMAPAFGVSSFNSDFDFFVDPVESP